MKSKKIKIIIGSIIGVFITILGIWGLISIFITEPTIQHSTITSDTKKQTTSNKTTTDNNKVETEYNNIVNGVNKIGITNLSNEQLTDFINQYMKFINNKNEDYYDKTIDRLVILKQEYLRRNNYDIVLDINMLRREPKVGMTENEIFALTKYIKPTDINKTTTKYGTSEQYVYNDDYLYFEDDKLTSIQD